jgi:hypothetical protein
MHKPAQAIPLRDREAIAAIKQNLDGKPLEAQLRASMLEFRATIRGIYFRLSQLELENHVLRREILDLKTGAGRADDAG